MHCLLRLALIVFRCLEHMVCEVYAFSTIYVFHVFTEVHFRILSEFDFPKLRKCTFVFSLHCLILHVCHLSLSSLMMKDFFGLVIGKMDDN